MKLEERFIASLRNLGIDANSVCVVALSGGGDSIALLDLILRIKSRYHLCCSAARVTHGIRDSESEDAENSFCERFCAERSIPFRVLSVKNDAVSEIRSRFGCGTEQAAREFRHRLLRKHMEASKARYIFYGHTSDDSMETIFMRLLSGSGAEGLGGISMLRGEAVRPLLRFERRELREYLVSHGVDWIEDASNSSKMYRRNRIRNELMPLMSDIFPGWPRALGVLGEKSQEAARALKKLRSMELDSTVECNRYMWNGEDWDSASGYSKALALWDAFNNLDTSNIPDRRISWRTLKEARRAVDARRTWNSHGFKLAWRNGSIDMGSADSPDTLANAGGRIILSRDEIDRGFAASIGSYEIAVSLQKTTHPKVFAFRIRNWPLEMRFDRGGVKLSSWHETKKPLSKEITDSEKEKVYIFIRKSEVELDGGREQ